MMMLALLWAGSVVFQQSVPMLSKDEDPFMRPIVVADHLLFVGSGGRVAVWETTSWDSGMRLLIQPQAAATPEHLVLAGTFKNQVTAFGLDGTEAWVSDVPGRASAPLSWKGGVLVHSGPGFVTSIGRNGEKVQQTFSSVTPAVWFGHPVHAGVGRVLLSGGRTEGQGGRLVLYDVDKGVSIWVYETETALAAPPVWGDGLVALKVGGVVGAVVVLEGATGEEILSHPVEDWDDSRHNGGLFGEGGFFIPVGRTLLRLDPQGEHLWSIEANGVLTMPAVGKGLVVVGSRDPGSSTGNGVGFFDAQTGSQVLWYPIPSGVQAPPLMWGQDLFVVGSDGTAYQFKLGVE